MPGCCAQYVLRPLHSVADRPHLSCSKCQVTPVVITEEFDLMSSMFLKVLGGGHFLLSEKTVPDLDSPYNETEKRIVAVLTGTCSHPTGNLSCLHWLNHSPPGKETYGQRRKSNRAAWYCRGILPESPGPHLPTGTKSVCRSSPDEIIAVNSALLF
jgi:hypothetical protein